MFLTHKLHDRLEKAGIPEADRHLFFCLGPDCCKYREGEELWEHVKRRTKQLGLKAMRTKVGCFRICKEGPWMVVYPEGTWYPRVTAERFERILKEHLLGGVPVEEWVIARNDLGACGEGRDGEGNVGV